MPVWSKLFSPSDGRIASWTHLWAQRKNDFHAEVRDTNAISSLGRVPVVAFRDFIHHIWKDVQRDHCMDMAAQMSYYFVLAIFPFFIFLAALVGHLPFTGLWPKIVTWLTQYFPRESRRLIIETVIDLTRGRKSFLSIGLLGTAWAACSGVLSLMQSLNAAYGVRETRSFRKRLGLASLMLLVLSFVFVASFGLLTTGTWLGHWMSARIKPGFSVHPLWQLVNWVLSVALLGLCISIVDYALPNLKRRWRWTTPGSLFVVLAWLLFSLVFNFYVGHIASYDKIYGALGAFVILMVWIYMTSLIILIGAEMNCELEKASSIEQFRANENLPQSRFT